MAFMRHPHRSGPLTDAEELLIQPMFDYLDHDRDGQLTYKQAVTLFCLLGYPSSKAEFKSTLVTMEDLLFVINSKKTTGALGKEDMEGRMLRLFQMMDPHVTTKRMPFQKFKSFVTSLDVKADDSVLRNIFDTICAQDALSIHPDHLSDRIEGFIDEDLVEYVTSTLPRSKRPFVPLEEQRQHHHHHHHHHRHHQKR